MPAHLTKKKAFAILLERYGDLTKAAHAIGYSESFYGRVASGKRPMGKKFAEVLFAEAAKQTAAISARQALPAQGLPAPASPSPESRVEVTNIPTSVAETEKLDNPFQIFQSRQFGSVRIISRDGELWFVAKDIATALEYSENSLKQLPNILRSVPEEWKGIKQINTLGGRQEMLIISEPGLYFFLNRSDKPAALPFQKWIAGKVIPDIRKTGSYSLQSAQHGIAHAEAEALINAAVSAMILAAKSSIVWLLSLPNW